MQSRRMTAHYKRWSATKSWREAANLARDGWHEGVKRIGDLSRDLGEDIGEILPETSYYMDVSGFEPDVGAYLAGEPEHMIDYTTTPGAGRHIHIVVNLSAAARHSAETLMFRGLLAAGVVDAFEQMGHQVTLDAVMFTQQGGTYDRFTMVSHVKRAGEPLDLERTAFALAHPAMLRRLAFAIMESIPDSNVRRGLDVGFSYGTPKDDPDEFMPGHEKPDLYIGSANDVESYDEVLERIKNYLVEAGVIGAT